MNKQASVIWLALLIAVGVATILDENLSQGWLAAKIVAVSFLAVVLGMSIATPQPKKKTKK